MDEKELNENFGISYSPPAEYDDVWERTIEVKLNKQGQILVGLGVGLGVTLLLTTLQGRVVINLVKGHKMVVEAINTISDSLGGIPGSNQSSNVSYSKPEKQVDTSTTEVDPEELDELKARLSDIPKPPTFGEEL